MTRVPTFNLHLSRWGAQMLVMVSQRGGRIPFDVAKVAEVNRAAVTSGWADLVAKGLVDKLPVEVGYALTDLGRKVVAELTRG